MRAVVYARVSSSAQRDRDTIASQLRDLPAYVEIQKWKLAGTYADDGKSASTGKLEARDGFARLVRDAEAKKFDIIVVRDIDRLTRTEDMVERAEILGTFQRLGIDIATPASGRQDLRSMMGEFYVTMQALVAAEENRKRRERIVAGQHNAVLLGRKGRGLTPYGLVFDKANGWSLDPERAPILREIYERIAAGDSCLTIAEDLDRRGAPRPHKLPWTRHRVWELAARSTHPSGSWMCRGGKIAVPVPAIVSVELFARAHEALKAKRKTGLDRTWHVYLLGKLGRCGECGQNIRVRTGFVSKHRSPSKARYLCVGRVVPLPPGAKRCAAEPVFQVEADERAWQSICRELEDPALIPALLAIRTERSGDTRDWENDVTGYKKHLARLEGVETALLARFRRGAIGETAMDKELVSLNRERKMLQEQISSAERARGATVRATRRLQDAEAIVARLREKLTTATQEERRDIMASLIEPGGAVFLRGQVRIEFWVERPEVTAENLDVAIATGRDWSNRHESELRIRVVA